MSDMLNNLSQIQKGRFLKELLNLINSDHPLRTVRVQVDPAAKINNCYYNVSDKVKHDGGKTIYGWAIWNSNYICEGEMHAVWQSPIGELIDITPRTNDFAEIQFVVVDNFTYSGMMVDNIRLNVTDNQVVDDWISVCKGIELIYRNGRRIDEDQVAIAENIKPLLSFLESIKPAFEPYLNNGGTVNTACFCGRPLSYNNCHGADFRKNLFPALKRLESLSNNN